MILLPRLFGAGNTEIGDRKSGQAGLGLRTPAGGSLVTNFAARTGGGAGEGGDGGGVIVGLNLAEDVDILVMRGVFSGLRIYVESTASGADEDRGVVFVG